MKIFYALLLVLPLSAVSQKASAADERQFVLSIITELQYLETKMNQGKAKKFDGQATGGKVRLKYGRLQADIRAWRSSLEQYLATPQREPLDVNQANKIRQ